MQPMTVQEIASAVGGVWWNPREGVAPVTAVRHYALDGEVERLCCVEREDDVFGFGGKERSDGFTRGVYCLGAPQSQGV